MGCLGVVSVEEVVSHERQRSYEHVKRKEMSDWVSACNELQVGALRGQSVRREIERRETSA